MGGGTHPPWETVHPPWEAVHPPWEETTLCAEGLHTHHGREATLCAEGQHSTMGGRLHSAQRYQPTLGGEPLCAEVPLSLREKRVSLRRGASQPKGEGEYSAQRASGPKKERVLCSEGPQA